MVRPIVQHVEFEYRRHGTQTLIAAFDVTIGPDRAGFCIRQRR
jgi:hypothetical protein